MLELRVHDRRENKAARRELASNQGVQTPTCMEA